MKLSEINEFHLDFRNAVIESYSISIQRDFILDMHLHLDYGGLGQAFGGYCLYLSKGSKNHSRESFAGHYIYRCMEVAEVDEVKELVGKTIRVALLRDRVYAIGHIIKDDWFCPTLDFKKE